MEEIDTKTENLDFDHLSVLYKKIKCDLTERNENGDKNEQFQYESIIKYIDDMLGTSEKDSNDYYKLLAMKASLYFEHAKMLMFTQFITIGLETFRHAMFILDKHELHPHISYLYFRIVNQLAFYLSKLEQLEEAKDILEASLEIYKILSNKSAILLYCSDDLFENRYLDKGNNPLKFERLITNNLQTLAWIYNRMSISNKFLIYHHVVLKRQLEMKDGSAFTWFQKCARLGAFFFGSYRFIEARHQLSAACTVVKEYELKTLKQRSEPQFICNWNHVRKLYAEAGRYWIKYIIFLLDASQRFNNEIPKEVSLKDLFVNLKQSQTSFQSPTTLSPDNEKKVENNSTQIQTKSVIEEKEALLNEITMKIVNAFDKQKNETDTSKTNEDPVEIENKDENVEKTIENNENIIETASTEELPNNENETEPSTSEEKIEEIVETNEQSLLNNEFSSDDSISSNVTVKENIQTKTQSTNTANSDTFIPIADNDSTYDFKFGSLNTTYYEARVTADPIQNSEQAKTLLYFIQEWFEHAKTFYTIEDYPVEYIELNLDLCDIYNYVSLFESDLDNQYEFQRRRVETLELMSATLKVARPQLSLFISIELLHELTQAQVDLLMLNIRRINSLQTSQMKTNVSESSEDVKRKLLALLDIRQRLGNRLNSEYEYRLTPTDLPQYHIL